MKIFKTILYIIVLSTFFLVDNSFGAFGLDSIDEELVGNTDSIDIVIQRWLVIVLGFLAIVAVIVGIFGGFKILTAGEDNEKVQSGKKIITYVIIGIIIIYSASLIVDFIVGTSTDPGILSNPEDN